jgi:hypothetical protein
LGAQEAAAGYGPTIKYATNTTALNDEWNHVWGVGNSDDLAGQTCGSLWLGMHSPGTLTVNNVFFTHDFEPLVGTACTDTLVGGGDPRSGGSHGIEMDNDTGSLYVTRSGCFSTGDACIFGKAANGTGTGGTLIMSDVSCGWIDGTGGPCFIGSTRIFTTSTITGAYVANVPSKRAECDETGGTQGAWCSADADCGGVASACDGITSSAIYGGASDVIVKDLVYFAGDGDSPIFSADAGETGDLIDGAFVLDARADDSVNAAILMQFSNIDRIRHVSAPFAVTPGALVREFSSNYYGRLRNHNSSWTALIHFNGQDSAGAAVTTRFKDNALVDILDAQVGDQGLYFTNAPPSGSVLEVERNFIDRSTVAGSIGVGFLDLATTTYDEANALVVRDNVISGWNRLLDCGTQHTTNPIFSNNVFAPASTITSPIGTPPLLDACAVAANRTALNATTTILNRYSLFGAGLALHIGGARRVGPMGVVGHAQTKWMTSLGIASRWLDFGSTSPELRPRLGPAQ